MDAAALRQKYGEVHPLARDKVLTRLDRHARAFIALSPFLVLGTADRDGNQDTSPRGDPPGFVQVQDDRTLLIPDRPGNRRVDSLANIAAHPKVGLLFLVPGFDETLRVNGTARLSDDPAVLARLAVQGRPALLAIVVTVGEVFFHCSKAFIRSRLWDPAARVERSRLPTLGRIIADQIAGVDALEADRDIDADYRSGLY
jgi:PPOX class probable FMN-dependent enzyme